MLAAIGEDRVGKGDLGVQETGRRRNGDSHSLQTCSRLILTQLRGGQHHPHCPEEEVGARRVRSMPRLSRWKAGDSIVLLSIFRS